MKVHLGNQTLGAWAKPFVLNRGKQDPRRSISESKYIWKGRGLLLRIIGGVCEYLWIDSPRDAIEALDDYAIFVSFDKVVVKQNPPNSMNKFPFAVGYEFCSVFCAWYIWYELIDSPGKLRASEISGMGHTSVENLCTQGMNAIGWHAPPSGRERAYFNRFLNERYIGQAEACPNAAKQVESDQSIIVVTCTNLVWCKDHDSIQTIDPSFEIPPPSHNPKA